MSRNKKDRTIPIAPNFNGFTPVGANCDGSNAVVLFFEEYEAIKRCDYELLPHLEAAKLMNVSRPTFTRIYESARRKIAKAFVEARCIQIEGGNAVASASWYECRSCKLSFTVQHESEQFCPICQTSNITKK